MANRHSWPPPPMVEDEAVSISHEYKPTEVSKEDVEVQERGVVEQQPIIQEALVSEAKVKPAFYKCHESDSSSMQSTSSAESLEPQTPLSATSDHYDHRRVHLVHDGLEMPSNYEGPNSSQLPKAIPPKNSPRSEQGKREMPKLNTAFTRKKSVERTRPRPRVERSQSSYAAPSSRPIGKSASGESFLSPVAMTPREIQKGVRFAEGQEVPFHSSVDQRRREEPTTPRPMLNRHQSATADLGIPVSPESTFTTSKKDYRLSDDSEMSADDNRRHRKSRLSSQYSPDSIQKTPALRTDELPDRDKRRASTRNSSSLLPPWAHPALGGSERALEGLVLQNLHHSIASADFERRRASPRSSPLSTPQATPPGTPPNERRRLQDDLKTPPKQSPTSRPSTPSESPRISRNSSLLSTEISANPTNRPPPGSRQTSPLPSPQPIHSGVPQPYANSREPTYSAEPNSETLSNKTQTRDFIGVSPPTGHNRSFLYNAQPQRPSGRQFPSTPMVHTQSTTLAPRPVPRQRSQSNNHLRQTWEDSFHSRSNEHSSLHSVISDPRPSTMQRALPQTVASSLNSPKLSDPWVQTFRERGPIQMACPCRDSIIDHNDWYTFQSYQYFNICPACREKISHDGYAKYLTKSFKSSHNSTTCDFGTPWVQLAWLVTVKDVRKNMDLLISIAEIEKTVVPCPGKTEAVRNWYRVVDPESRKQISDFEICPCCAKRLETLFPQIKVIIQPAQSRYPDRKKLCSLRLEGSRWPQYIDLLDNAMKDAKKYRRDPNLLKFVQLARKVALIPECPGDEPRKGYSWHVMRGLLDSDFVVCDACWEDEIYPLVREDNVVATSITWDPEQMPPSHEAICQFDFKIVRKAFKEACQRADATIFQRFWQEHRHETRPGAPERLG